MAKHSITQLKQWFENGDYPTQQQFWDWMDSYFHKDDKIAIDSIDGLLLLLQTMTELIGQAGSASQGPTVITGVPSFEVPAGMLIDKIIIQEAASINLTIGTEDTASDLSNAAVQGVAVLSNFDYYRLQPSTIYFGGITANTIISIYKR